MKARRILTAVSAVALLSVAVDGTSAVSAQASSWSNQPQRSGGACTTCARP